MMQIRWYQIEDEPHVLNVHESIRSTITDTAFFNWPEKVFRDELSLSKTLVAEDSGGVQGFIAFREYDNVLEIMVLGTHAQKQKQGCMGHLLRSLQFYAAEQGKPISLEVHIQNHPARGLYLKNSFELSHQRKNYYPDGEAAEIYIWKKK